VAATTGRDEAYDGDRYAPTAGLRVSRGSEICRRSTARGRACTTRLVAVIDRVRDGRGVGDDARAAGALVAHRRASFLRGAVGQRCRGGTVVGAASIGWHTSASCRSLPAPVRSASPCSSAACLHREVLLWVPNGNGACSLRSGRWREEMFRFGTHTPGAGIRPLRVVSSDPRTVVGIRASTGSSQLSQPREAIARSAPAHRIPRRLTWPCGTRLRRTAVGQARSGVTPRNAGGRLRLPAVAGGGQHYAGLERHMRPLRA
jgi:hypothetical protein